MKRRTFIGLIGAAIALPLLPELLVAESEPIVAYDIETSGFKSVPCLARWRFAGRVHDSLFFEELPNISTTLHPPGKGWAVTQVTDVKELLNVPTNLSPGWIFELVKL